MPDINYLGATLAAIWLRCVRQWHWIAISVALASCAIAEPMYPPHVVITRNAGTGALTDVVIDYGKQHVLRDSTPRRPGGVTDNGVLAPVPREMTVSWRTEDGRQHAVSVPLRSRISHIEKLKGFELLFYDERVEVYHLTSAGSKDEFTHRTRIYPDSTAQD